MTLFSLLKKCLFQLDAERAHHLSIFLLRCAQALPQPKPLVYSTPPVQVMGLSFPHRVGLAAGFDKHGECMQALSNFGFAFIEIGSITPKPQVGNPRPRLFRLKEHEAIINRMGFNSKGSEYTVNQLKKNRFKGILGINIGKNKETPLEKAHEDYIFLFQQFSPFASYITINISSPNTQGLRDLQSQAYLMNLLSALKNQQSLFFKTEKKTVPLVLKISPDLSDLELEIVLDAALKNQIDGIIISNTTISRTDIETHPLASEMGGLSGKPLLNLSNIILKKSAEFLKGKIPLIASGGVMDENIAQEKLNLGADLVQVYTGMIYHDIDWLKSADQLRK